MDYIDNLINLMKIIYPEFQLLDSEGETHVLLHTGQDEASIKEQRSVFNTRTDFESFCNHFHIIECFDVEFYEDVFAVCDAISKNLIRTLSVRFPEREFIVYLELLNSGEATLRFHQIWAGENKYYDDSFCISGTSIYRYTN